MTVIPSNLPSNRIFGLFFTGVFAVLGLYGFWVVWPPILNKVFFAVSIILAAITLLRPALLNSLNRAWYQLGLFLGRVVSPIVLGILFFLLITPVALVIRIAGRDALRLRRKNVDSYWIDRSPPGPKADSFRDQF